MNQTGINRIITAAFMLNGVLGIIVSLIRHFKPSAEWPLTLGALIIFLVFLVFGSVMLFFLQRSPRPK